MNIRKASSADLEAMKSIVSRAHHGDYAAAGEYYSVQEWADPNYSSEGGPYYSHETFVEDMLRHLGEKIAPPFETSVAVEGDRVIGFIIVEHHHGHLWISNICVEPDSKGAGRALVDHILSGGDETYLWVNAKNPAVKFWEKMGFEERLTEKLMIRKNGGRK